MTAPPARQHRREMGAVYATMNWIGAISRFIVTTLGIGVLKSLSPYFPPLGLPQALVIALFVAGIGLLADEMLGPYLSPHGRPLVGFVVTVGVLGIAFTRVYYPGRHHPAYVGAAIIIAGLVLLGDLAVAKRLRSKHTES